MYLIPCIKRLSIRHRVTSLDDPVAEGKYTPVAN